MRVVVGVDLDEGLLPELRLQFPEIEFVEALGREALFQAMPDCDIIFGGHPKDEHVDAAPRLKWVQSFSAGVNSFPMPKLRERSIPLTNASGAHSVQIAENIIAMVLAFSIRLPEFVRAQDSRLWRARELAPLKQEVEGSAILIAGLGGIGLGLARKAKGLGMRVVGVRNRDLPPPPNVDEIVPKDALLSALGRADHVALCLPLTEETTGFLGERELRAMKPSAFVYNVGRGKSIDREAMLRALREGWIAGAGLDVTDPEPLPEDDPLWGFPNVILSQHTSGSSPKLDRRVCDIFAANLRRFLRGEPMQNLVDFDRTY
jgi:phosphoglycerate dehydrogenase-like enzyme